MELQLALPVPSLDFNFDSACSTPYRSAPSSPQRFGNFFYSAPTSPTTTSIIPFQWEEKPGIPKLILPKNRVLNEDHLGGGDGGGDDDDGDDDVKDFAFDFSGQLEKPYVSADELFHKGKIRPLKPPPRLQSSNGGFGESNHDFNDIGNFKSAISSPRSPISLKKKAFSPRWKKLSEDSDPFEEALRKEKCQNIERGRENERDFDFKFLRKPKTRSLSPFRVSDILCEHDQEKASPNSNTDSNSTSNSFLESFSLYRAYKKIKLKDLLLFRSTSEGRATSTESIKKYEVFSKQRIYKKSSDDLRNLSFRSTDSAGSSSGGGSVSRRRGIAPPLSAHELHYKVNRAVSEEMRKKTFLPYKQGLLGCLGFNSALNDISRGRAPLTRV